MRISLIIAAVLALTACQQKREAPPAASEADETGGVKGVHRDSKGKLPPDAQFTDGSGKPVRIAML